MPSKSVPFTTRVEPVSPPSAADKAGDWWRRRVPPPGPQRLFRAVFIAIVTEVTEQI
jgi:hypothetical protein